MHDGLEGTTIMAWRCASLIRGSVLFASLVDVKEGFIGFGGEMGKVVIPCHGVGTRGTAACQWLVETGTGKQAEDLAWCGQATCLQAMLAQV
jgi:hypothetical protein